MAQNILLINVDIGETRVAVIEQGILAELYVERASERSSVGNVYLGKVTRVLPGMQAAFVDIGLERAAFLHVEDVMPAQDAEALEDDDDEDGGASKQQPAKLTRKTPIREVLTEGQHIVVQVSKGPIGTKGARVTGHISMPGRYAVYLPTVEHVGVSKRIGRDQERKKLKQILQSLKPAQGGLIIRSVAQGMTKGQLKADIGYLVRMWEQTKERAERQRKAPAVLYQELDIVLRAVRDLFTDSVEAIVIDGKAEYERLRDFLEVYLPHRVNDVIHFEGSEPLFDEYGVEDEIARSLSRKVPLPSGGYLIIDQAEALTAIDVNTGRFIGKGKDVEDTILQTNLEAAREIGYQLRFRNIGGLIVLDFIDMEKQRHRDKVFHLLQDVLRKDKARTSAVQISELGLVEMTRKRTRESLNRTLNEPCFYCDGSGQLHSKVTICHQVVRQMMRERASLPGYQITVHAHPAVCDVLEHDARAILEEASSKLERRILLVPKREYHMEQFDLLGS